MLALARIPRFYVLARFRSPSRIEQPQRRKAKAAVRPLLFADRLRSVDGLVVPAVSNLALGARVAHRSSHLLGSERAHIAVDCLAAPVVVHAHHTPVHGFAVRSRCFSLRVRHPLSAAARRASSASAASNSFIP
jgi:hypothetical protein